jgi:hypothetical protein
MQCKPFLRASALFVAALALGSAGAALLSAPEQEEDQEPRREGTDPWVLLRRARLEEGLIRSERTAVLLGELLANRPTAAGEETP